MSIKLGQTVRNIVNGTEGIAVARSEYLNGCVRYCIEPRAESPTKVVTEVDWADEQQVVVIDNGVREEMGLDRPDSSLPAASVGGPAHTPPRW